MDKTDPIIRTKLRLPFTRPGLVSRPRLQEQVALGLRGPLTLVTAPAGFGKTTLAASCVAGCGMPVAWLSLDKDDNRADRFLTYLIAALQGADSRVGGEAAQLMAGMPPAPPEAVLASLVNDLDGAVAEMVLVLDDYQFISSQAVHDEMAFLLEHFPNTLHLVIASRSDPPLPIARLRARGQVVELRSADLSFTQPEAAQFLNDVMGLSLDAEMVATLEERTEGWVAGLQMAALSMRDRKDVFGFIEGFSGTNRYILDYLLEEVLASQPPEIQRFLVSTSILERLTAPLCDFIIESRESRVESSDESRLSTLYSRFSTLYSPLSTLHSRPILDYLEKANLFLIPLDDERTWYRYHHLFADLLRARLQQTDAASLPGLHQRASAWLEQNGLIPEAVYHLLAAHEEDQAAGLIERYTPAHWANSDLSVIQMADSLPPEMLLTRPKIGVYQVWYLILQGQIEKVLPLLKDMLRLYGGPGAPPDLKWIGTFALLTLIFLTPPSAAGDLGPFPGEEVLDDIPAGEPVLRDAANILYGMALGRRDELDHAADFSLRYIQKDKLLHGALAIPTLVPFLATIYIFQGRLHAAAALCREFLEPIKERGIRVSTAGNLDVLIGGVLLDWNYLDEAEKYLREGMRANEPWGNIMTDAFGMLALAQVLKSKGDYAGALQIVDKFEARLQGKNRPSEFSEDFRTLRVQVQLAGGEMQAAFRWADQVLQSEDYHLYPQFYRVTLARIRLAQARYAEVEELLADPSALHLAGNRLLRQLESSLLLAAAAAGQQRLPQAFALLESALALAEPEEYMRVFLDVGEPVRDLLAAYLRTERPAHKPYAQKLLEAFSPSGAAAPGAQPGGLVEPLSERELEVLRLMALGRTNQDIARQLVVARGTIKAHAASIFRKLDVNNRTAAVAVARQLGILS